MNRRRGILLALLGVVLALVGIVFAGAVLRQSVAPLPAPTQPPPITMPVVITTRNVLLRTVLKAEDLAVVKVPVELVPLDAVSELDKAIGMITKIPLSSGEMLMKHHLANPTNLSKDLAFIIGDDQVVMALPATDLMSKINILQPGDLVDILVSVEVPVLPADQSAAGGEEVKPEDELFTFDALQRVEISAVIVKITQQARQSSASATRSTLTTSASATPTPTPTPAPSEIESQAVLVALAPQDALVLKHLIDAGGVLDIVLRAPTSDQVFDLNPVTSEYLKDRYELVIER